jgi:formylglycine-generating enzyme required for sulfatase activity
MRTARARRLAPILVGFGLTWLVGCGDSAAGQRDAAQPDAAPQMDAQRDAPGPQDAGPQQDASVDCFVGDAAVAPGLTWVTVPAGTYQMGMVPGDALGATRETPRHTVDVAVFDMMATEITQEQYQAVMGSNPSAHSACATCPVEQITWQQAKDFCVAVGGRLPSEAEWEYAARGGTATIYSCGDDPACLADIAWYSATSDTGNGAETHPVATKAANGFGLFDMSGNVHEWNEDCLHLAYGGAPSTGEVWVGGSSEDCSRRILRGGAYGSSNEFLRASARGDFDPPTPDNRLGARCARDHCG